MTTSADTPRTGPESAGTPGGTAAPAERARDAVSFLMGGRADLRRESVRVAIGLSLVAVLAMVLLNIGIYQNALSHHEQQRWAQLAADTDESRDALRDALHRIGQQARYVAGDDHLAAWTLQAADGRLAPDDRVRFEGELVRAARHFDFVAARVMGSDDVILASTPGDRVADRRGLAALAARARRSGGSEFTYRFEAGSTSPLLLVAVPIADTGRGAPAAVLAFDARFEDVVEPLLHPWSGYGASAGAYLVASEGDAVRFLSSPATASGIRAGSRVPLADGHQRPASMAASGEESSIETRGAAGAVDWAVTRHLPELGWGLVGEVPRRVMLQGMRATLIGLLVLDLAMVVLSLTAFVYWRRQYIGSLAQHENEVTRRYAERLRTVLDHTFDAILAFDHRGFVWGANHAAERLFGRPESDLCGCPIGALLRPAPVLGGPADAEHAVFHAEALAHDGHTVPVEVAMGRSGEGEERRYSVTVRDISDRLESERRIRAFAEGLEVSNRRLEEANAQLEEASRLKSEFLANTSHELRTPLNGMIGFLQLVLDGMCDSEEEEREFLKQALQCSRHLLGLINDVLDIAKIEAGKLTLEIERIDIGALFDEVYTVSHVQAAQKGLTLVFVPPEERLLGVRGDFGKVKQVLINLVGNSLKFTARGTITVRALPEPELGYVMFEVVDTGVGIPEDRQKVIFEKFTQGDGSTTRRYGGTGLGLAISKSLVELMGGIIGVHSVEGKGTRMYFSLPVWRDAVEEEFPTEETAAERVTGPSGAPLVMIVEDDPTFRLFLSTLFHQHGYRTVEARNAEIGWMLARRLRPAAVVLDYALTSSEGASLRTGWDLAERMTADPKTRHIPVVFVTGFDGELKGRLRATAFARRPHHLQKPVEPQTLLAKIREVVGSESGRNVRVLMADDDPSVSAYVRKVLPEERFQIDVVANGEECLHLLRTQPRGYDLLLLDLMMPQVSGYDVLREMTLSGVAPELPVLVLTNFPDARNEEERRLLQDGLVLDVVPKVAVHDNPALLPHVIDWHLQVARESGADEDPDDTPEEKAA